MHRLKVFIPILILFLLCLTGCRTNDLKDVPSEENASEAIKQEEIAKDADKQEDAEQEDAAAENTDTEANAPEEGEEMEEHLLILSVDTASLDGTAAEIFDYTWHCDPTTAHDEVKNAPAEYYTGTKPDTDAAVYIDRELYYYPLLPEQDFSLVNYDGEEEWAYYYHDEENEEYIFATLPKLGFSFPSNMMHSEEEAAENLVLHITKAGTYRLQGTWQGQINIDLGDSEEVFTDPSSRVTLILDGVDVSCSAAPGIIFSSVYECDNTWEDREEALTAPDTSEAGAVVVLADGSENFVTGENVYRMLKTKYKDESASDSSAVMTQKKMRKTDGAFYSYMTMNIMGEEEGTGSLTVTSGFEGIDSELHLSFLGAQVVVYSQDDGINVNEDNVSVVGFLGGTVELHSALGAEGDGVDSNGYVLIDGGTIEVNGIVAPDSALDSEDGITYLSGTVIIDGEEQNYTPGETFRETGEMGGMPGGPGGMGGEPGQQPPDMPQGGPGGQQPPAMPDGMPEGPAGMGGEPGQQPPNMPGGQLGQQPPAFPDDSTSESGEEN